jgi:hypothetical protein
MEMDEIIRRLEKIANHAIHFIGDQPFVMSLDDGIAVKDAIALLKEQEPKQIVRKQGKRENSDGSIDYFGEWYCPHCGKLLNRGFDLPWIEHCYKCGGEVKWDE